MGQLKKITENIPHFHHHISSPLLFQICLLECLFVLSNCGCKFSKLFCQKKPNSINGGPIPPLTIYRLFLFLLCIYLRLILIYYGTPIFN